MAYEEMMQGKMRIEYAKYLGKVDQGVICFPKESIGIKLPSFYAGNIWWVNTSESFGLRLPQSGVNQVEMANDAPVEYCKHPKQAGFRVAVLIANFAAKKPCLI